MPNPVLNEKTSQAAPATWAAPEPAPSIPPINDGPVSTWRPKVMTINGTVTATATLFVLLLASAAVGWIQTGGPESRHRRTGERVYSY